MKKLKTAFYHLKSKTNKKGEAPVYLRIKYDGKAINLSTSIYLKSDDWDRKKLKVKAKHERSSTLNSQLKQLEEKTHTIFDDAIAKGISVSIKQIQLVLQNKTGDIKALISLVDYFIAHIERDPNYSNGTIRHYKSFKNKLSHFLSHRYRLVDFDLEDLNYEFILNLEVFLSSVYKNVVNTVTKNMKRLKAIINIGLRLGWLRDNPFKNYKCKSETSHRQFLTREELKAIQTVDLSEHGKLVIVKDIFLFMAYTGISYSDVIRLTSSNITAVNGNKMIRINRAKTNEPCIVPLLPSAQELIEKYNDSESCKFTGTLLPVRTNQSLNRGLKVIAQMAGINKKVSCHIARHTFATLSLEKVPIETVSKALGHSSIKTTQIYAKVTEIKMYTDYSAMKTVFSY